MKKDNNRKTFYKLFGNLFLVLLFTLTAITIFLPEQEYSSTEKRPLSGFPALTVDSLKNGDFMDGIEDWKADQFPFRDTLMQLKAQLNIGLGTIRSQGVYRCEDGSLVEEFTMPSDEKISEQNSAIKGFASRYPDLDVYFCLVPNAISIETEKLPDAVLTDDQNLYMDEIKDAFKEVGTFVDVRDSFHASKQEVSLYYNTDHHWTTDAAYLAYQILYKDMGLSSNVSYTSGVVCNTFKGSLVSSSGFSAPCYDVIKIYIPEEDPIYTVTYNSTQTMTATVYSTKHLQGDDPYELFFGGNHPKITIQTGADTDRKLLILKDSYANCLVPFLLADYSQITMIDARYYYDDLDMEVQSAGYTDVLFLYNVNTLSEDNYLVSVLQNEQWSEETESDSGSENVSDSEDTSDSENASEDNSESDQDSESDANTESSDTPVLTIDDIAFVGDSRTLSMSSGGRLEYQLIPGTSIYATWGGKITDDTAKANATSAAASDKKLAIFWYGINDVQGNPATRDDATLFRTNYEALIDLYTDANPDSEIVILTILTTSVHEKDYYDKQEENIRRYNEQLSSLCSKNGYIYLDITSLYTGDTCFAEGDYIHFSKEWYESTFLPYLYQKLNIK